MVQTANNSDPAVYTAAAALLNKHASKGPISGVLGYIYSRSGRAFVCAGAARDCLYSVLKDSAVHPRDIDIGIDGLSKNQFADLGLILNAEQNEYGGYSVQFTSELKADLWRLEDTVGTTLHGCESTLMNVLRSFVLDINAVAFEPATGEFFDIGALNALRSGVIGVVPSALLHSEPQFAARAAILAMRFSFRLSAELDDLVYRNWSEPALSHQLRKHYFGNDSTEEVRSKLRRRWICASQRPDTLVD